ncbi:MAG TPA: [Fe-Fe] hydrogenase large subunit C-terminal domain-containing protein [Syntrophorhabdaceae bacterium]|nr:[Fe-Fe] hydrogenase large subunit C-terminal domain-containing protein [Syntrophorhabdaceae bacterium]HQM80803.1 [Fe-Fe] hydrogenase large subunit C-terminal domain-containing protein [Syntrophorhabdaceae bacterium]
MDTAQNPISQENNSVYGIDVNNRKCRLCLYCVQLCPAKAIKLEKEEIRIIPERCILCGSCLSGCPHQAMSYRSSVDEVKRLFFNNEKTVACLDPAFPAVFDVGTPRQLVTALKRLGFTEVWEGAFGAELVSQAYRELLQTISNKTIISSFCPVIVLYIQKYLPQLVPNIAKIVSPMIAIGRVARKIKGEGWKIVYLTPCLAHMGEASSPEVVGTIDYVITFRDIKNMLDEAGIDRKSLEESDFDGPKPFIGRIVSVIGGLNRIMGESFDVLDDERSVTYGRRRTIGALNQLANGYIQAKFLDFLYCSGCVDGPFVDRELSVLGRRQIIARYAKGEMEKQDVSAVLAELDSFADINLSREFNPMEQTLPMPTEEQIRAVLKKMDKMMPNRNLDCRACGYATCREKAIAVAQGITEAEYCLPYLLERSKRIYQQLEKSHHELQVSHQELEQAQYQLIRTEKLAALGQLAAGVAHEINNPLGTITIYAHILMKGMEPDDPRREDLALIISEANRTKEIVQGLLSFARETKLKPGETNINELLDDILGLLVNQSLFHNIKIKKAFAPGLPNTFADATQLKQVFLNIILNGAQAMEGKGNMTITTALEKDRIKVKIRDSGPGIPPENVRKLFNPFFTTKEKGTGLGLAISYGIVERHGGTLDVETELGKGSTFIVSLPVTAEGEQEEATTNKDLVQTINTGRKHYGQKTKNPHY